MESQLLCLIIAKHVLVSIIFLASLLWLSWWLASEEPIQDPKYLDRLVTSRPSRFFRMDGKYGMVIVYEAMPIVVMALLSFGVIELRRTIKSLQAASAVAGSGKGTRQACHARPSIVTYPLVVHCGWWNPMGVMTAAEVLFVAGLLFLVLYNYGRCTYIDFKQIEEKYSANPKLSLQTPLRLNKLDKAAENLAHAALIPFSLLWIPVSRGSPLLRLIKVPFEHAVKYHMWLAVTALTLLTGHALCYIVYFYQMNKAYEIVQWVTEREKCAVVAGFIAWLAGLTMFVTSLSFVRRRWYEIFFGVHHLYIVFFVFWLYHASWTIHFFIIPVLLFVIDRFLRMVQSRQSVDVLSAKVLESGAIQLRIATSAQSTQAYHALSSWYLRFPSLSMLMKLQWHFFSVTSTPLDEKPELSIAIKPQGKWTTSLQNQLMRSVEASGTTGARCPFSFKAGIEGPYGDETDFFLRYNTLVLVGGGIGVTPLLALLCDVLHRHRRGQGAIPSSIHVYHCVRKPQELCVLNSIDPNEISPDYEKRGLNLRVSVFVTSTVLTDYKNTAMGAEGAAANQQVLSLSAFGGSTWKAGSEHPDLCSPVTIRNAAGPAPKGVSPISTKGNPLWVATTMLATIGGFYILWGLSNVYIVKSLNANFPTNFNRVHMIVASMVLATLIFGGFIVLIWWLHSKQSGSSSSSLNSQRVGIASTSPPDQSTSLANESKLPEITTNLDEESTQAGSPWNGNLHVGVRPIWSDVFNALDKEYKGQNIGVLVSGSQSMQANIAKECQRHTKLFDTSATSNVLHYHSVSFEL